MRAAVEFEALQAAGGGGSAPDATAKGGMAKGVEPGNWVESPMAEEDAEGVDGRHIPNYRTPTLTLTLTLTLTVALTLTLTLTLNLTLTLTLTLILTLTLTLTLTRWCAWTRACSRAARSRSTTTR